MADTSRVNMILEKLNKNLPTDDFDINLIKNLVEKLKNDKTCLENELKNACNKNVPETLKEIEETSKQVEELVNEVEELEISVQRHSGKVQRVQDIANEYINQIKPLERTKSYIRALQRIEEISNRLEGCLSDKSNRAVDEYLKLCSLTDLFKNSTCVNLTAFLRETVCYWHSILKDRYGKDYEELIKNLKWPYLGANVPLEPTTEMITSFQALTEVLIQIQLPSSCEPSALSDTSTVPLSIPIVFLIRPLKKRFIFHFSGSKQTNNPEKPEWYFTQILTWIKDHQSFCDKILQPVYEKLGYHGFDARIEFIRGLVQIAMEKLHWDLPHLQYDDVLFSHTVDEALGFARELRDGYGYPDDQPNIYSILTQADYFKKWINLEKKYGLEKLDAIMNSEFAFEKFTIVEDGDFTTECVNKFLNLLSTLTERYFNLPQPGHRLQFLELQLHLLDDFRVRLLQLQGEDNVLQSSILNSVNGLIYVLEEWAVMPHFLYLQFFKDQLNETKNNNGVFGEVISLFSVMQDQLISNLTSVLSMEVEKQCVPYCRERWHTVDYFDPDVTTPSAIPMFNTLTIGLNAIYKALTPRLQTRAIGTVARDLDEYLYVGLVLESYFSELGVRRFANDVKKNLLPLFGQYLQNANSFFPRLCDAVKILEFPLGTALLLESALNESETNGESLEVLSNLGITELSANQVRNVLLRRNR